jgi:nucleotide-binding universal stress UspA family protein
MKNIVVPIDFTKKTQMALDLAVVFAESIVADIELVHVIENEHPVPGKEQLKESLIEQSLIKLTQKYIKHNPDLHFNYILKRGELGEAIISQAASYKEAFIVIGTHSEDLDWKDKLFGTVLTKMIDTSNHPICTLNVHHVPNKIKRIVLPLENTTETREKVPFTTHLAKLFNAEVDIITVNTSGIVEIDEKLKAYGLQVSHHFKLHNVKNKITQLTGANFADVVVDYSNIVQADMISVMTEHQKHLANLFQGSYTQQLIEKANIPVMLYPTKQIGYIKESFQTSGISY